MRSSLGFGMMRLPVLDHDPVKFDYDQIFKMVDLFLQRGGTYFDTSYVYHSGKSEEATRKAVVERYPRDAYTVATKFPTFLLQKEEEIEPLFAAQLQNLGVDSIDYYLLHNLQTVNYDGIDGRGGAAKQCHLFEHALKWKRDGRIAHLGFSHHSSPQLLDRILTEHPEVEFVQISVNYLDWDSGFVRARECYEVIRRHGKQVIVMEPVKGGGLSMVPDSVRNALAKEFPGSTPAEIALRFTGRLEGVLTTLSGMSTLEQVEENLKTYAGLDPLTEEECRKILEIAQLYRAAGPAGTDLPCYHGLTLYGIPVTSIMEAYSVCQLQPDPGFSDENNYIKNAVAEASHLDIFGDLPAERIVLSDGTDATDEVMRAFSWLKEHSF